MTGTLASEAEATKLVETIDIGLSEPVTSVPGPSIQRNCAFESPRDHSTMAETCSVARYSWLFVSNERCSISRSKRLPKSAEFNTRPSTVVEMHIERFVGPTSLVISNSPGRGASNANLLKISILCDKSVAVKLHHLWIFCPEQTPFPYAGA